MIGSGIRAARAASCAALLLVLAAAAPRGAAAAPAPYRAGVSCGARGVLADSACALLGEEARRATWGVLAVSLDRGDTLLALAPARRLVPGSNLKLFTTGALLRRIGPDARRRTLLVARGHVDLDHGGEVRFKGDLVLRGSGMPDVVQLLRPGSRGLLDSLAELLHASGLRRFEGTLWVDGTLFARAGYPHGWPLEDLALGYGAPVNPILANGNAATIIATGAQGGVAITTDPPDAPIHVLGTVSRGDAGTPASLSITREPFSPTVRVSGSVPPGGVVKRSVALFDPDSTDGLLLLGALRRAGIAVKAAVRVWSREAAGAPALPPHEETEAHPAAPAGAPRAAWSSVRGRAAELVLAVPSPPARQVVQAVDAWSLNIETEALLRLLDPAREGKAPDRAIRALRETLTAAGVDGDDMSLVDGSGLSPQDLVTARAVVAWLASLDRDSTLGGPFEDLLATPGSAGTMEQRLLRAAPDSTIHAKTGTLTNVSALSGYLRTRAGERIAFSILSNGNPGSVGSARGAEDALVSLLLRTPPRLPAATRRVVGIPR